MGFGGSSPPPPSPPPPPNPGTPVNAASQARANQLKQAAIAGGAGFDDTVKNAAGDAGVASAPVERKQLLGS